MSILKTRNRRHDFRERNQHIRTRLRPHTDLYRGTALVGARQPLPCELAAHAGLVDVRLHDGGPHHGSSSDEVAGGNLLDGRQVDVQLAQERVADEVHEGYHDDERERVEVRQDVVGDAIQPHRRRLRDEVVVDLVVADPEQWIPQEHGAGADAAAHLVDPCVVKGHPLGAVGGRDVGGFYGRPEGAVVEVAVGLSWVERPAAFVGIGEELEGFG